MSNTKPWLMCLLVVALMPLTARAQNFTFTNIDIPGADWTELNGINNSRLGLRSRRTIIGTYHDISGKHGFSLSGGILTTIPNPPMGKDTEALGINNQGVIVGTYMSISNPTSIVNKPFRFSSGILTDIPQFAYGASYEFASEAYGINDQGVIVGTCQYVTNDGLGGGSGLYLTNTGLVSFGPGVARNTILSGVNDSGSAVGWFTDAPLLDPPFPAHGFVLAGGYHVVDVPNSRSTWLRGINSRNQVVGYYWDGQGKIHGFLWDPGAPSPITLDVPGALSTYVHGISDPDPLTGTFAVVGTYVLTNGSRHGFLAARVPLSAP